MSNDPPQTWGQVQNGAEITDITLPAVYRVQSLNEWVILIDRTTGHRLTFKPLDAIDHARFKIGSPR